MSYDCYISKSDIQELFPEEISDETWRKLVEEDVELHWLNEENRRECYFRSSDKEETYFWFSDGRIVFGFPSNPHPLHMKKILDIREALGCDVYGEDGRILNELIESLK